MTDDEERKSFEQLVAEKAGCLEFVWNGYIRMYEEGEERCQCNDCIAMNKLKAAFDEIYTKIPIDIPFGIPKPTSIARIEDIDKSFMPSPSTDKG